MSSECARAHGRRYRKAAGSSRVSFKLSSLKRSCTNARPIGSNEYASDVPRKQDRDNWSARRTLATFPS